MLVFSCGIGVKRTYVDGQVSWFDHCDGESWSFFWIEEMIAMLGYDVSSPKLRIYWLLPGKSVADGLRIVSSDEETIVMKQITHKVKIFVLYFDHQNQVAKAYDDIVLDPIAVLPNVISPKKSIYVEKKEGEKLPAFYKNLKSSLDDQVAESEPESDDEEDSDFVDSDYEVEDEDDDLFVDSVVEEYIDDGT